MRLLLWNTLKQKIMEVWGGIECTINRVSDHYFDQLEYQGHFHRREDLQMLVDLGIKKIRYPILWEKHRAVDQDAEWALVEENLTFLKSKNVQVIAGLVHHGSGPRYVEMTEDSFVEGLASYAAEVAEKFPWIEYYTPINEPLTTARFCGLYGLWYPHYKSESTFLKILINECKGTIAAMQAIRKINPGAKLLHTEDLGKAQGTTALQYQADFENERRWLGIDLICGLVDQDHLMFEHLISNGIKESELDFFRSSAMPPDILGFNHYVTSERYLDENIDRYPAHLHGGNGKCRYADVEAVRVAGLQPVGIKVVLKEAWDRYQLPMAITEAHLYCGREDQMRWLNGIWNAANDLVNEGVPIHGVTAWSLFGAYGWHKLLTSPFGNYENGTFDISSGAPRATALSKMIQAYSTESRYDHPVLQGKGWWETEKRIIYPSDQLYNPMISAPESPVIMIIGASGMLGNEFVQVCQFRDLNFVAPAKEELNLIRIWQIENAILKYRPWAVINAAGFVNVEAAENEYDDCFLNNSTGPENLAICCKKFGIKLVTFSSDLVFDGEKQSEYLESDEVNPLNIYGLSKAAAEQRVLKQHSEALIIRTSSFFSLVDQSNFIYQTLACLQQKKTIRIADDVFISPTYVPDLVNRTLDLLIDEDCGIWHLTNNGTLSWFDLAKEVAERAKLKSSLLISSKVAELQLKAKRPLFSAMRSNRGLLMPNLDHALDRFFDAFHKSAVKFK